MATPNKSKALDWLEQANAIVAQINPLIGLGMTAVKLVLDIIKRPDTDPALRRLLIEQMRAGAQEMQAVSDDWLAEHGYDAQGNKLPSA